MSNVFSSGEAREWLCTVLGKHRSKATILAYIQQIDTPHQNVRLKDLLPKPKIPVELGSLSAKQISELITENGDVLRVYEPLTYYALAPVPVVSEKKKFFTQAFRDEYPNLTQILLPSDPDHLKIPYFLTKKRTWLPRDEEIIVSLMLEIARMITPEYRAIRYMEFNDIPIPPEVALGAFPQIEVPETFCPKGLWEDLHGYYPDQPERRMSTDLLDVCERYFIGNGSVKGQVMRMIGMAEVHEGKKGHTKPKRFSELGYDFETFAKLLENTLPLAAKKLPYKLDMLPSQYAVFKDEDGTTTDYLPKTTFKKMAGLPFEGKSKGEVVESTIAICDEMMKAVAGLVKTTPSSESLVKGLDRIFLDFWYAFTYTIFPKIERYEAKEYLTKTRNIFSFTFIMHLLTALIVDPIMKGSNYNASNSPTCSLYKFSPYKGGIDAFLQRVDRAMKDKKNTIDFVYADNWYIVAWVPDDGEDEGPQVNSTKPGQWKFYSIDLAKGEANATMDTPTAVMYYLLTRGWVDEDGQPLFNTPWFTFATLVVPMACVEAPGLFGKTLFEVPGQGSGNTLTFHINHAVTTALRDHWIKLGRPLPGTESFDKLMHVTGINFKIERTLDLFASKMEYCRNYTPTQGFLQLTGTDWPTFEEGKRLPRIEMDLLGWAAVWSHALNKFVPVLETDRLMKSFALPYYTGDTPTEKEAPTPVQEDNTPMEDQYEDVAENWDEEAPDDFKQQPFKFPFEISALSKYQQWRAIRLSQLSGLIIAGAWSYPSMYMAIRREIDTILNRMAKDGFTTDNVQEMAAHFAGKSEFSQFLFEKREEGVYKDPGIALAFASVALTRKNTHVVLMKLNSGTPSAPEYPNRGIPKLDQNEYLTKVAKAASEFPEVVGMMTTHAPQAAADFLLATLPDETRLDATIRVTDEIKRLVLMRRRMLSKINTADRLAYRMETVTEIAKQRDKTIEDLVRVFDRDVASVTGIPSNVVIDAQSIDEAINEFKPETRNKVTMMILSYGKNAGLYPQQLMKIDAVKKLYARAERDTPSDVLLDDIAASVPLMLQQYVQNAKSVAVEIAAIASKCIAASAAGDPRDALTNYTAEIVKKLDTIKDDRTHADQAALLSISTSVAELLKATSMSRIARKSYIDGITDYIRGKTDNIDLSELTRTVEFNYIKAKDSVRYELFSLARSCMDSNRTSTAPRATYADVFDVYKRLHLTKEMRLTNTFLRTTKTKPAAAYHDKELIRRFDRLKRAASRVLGPARTARIISGLPPDQASRAIASTLTHAQARESYNRRIRQVVTDGLSGAQAQQRWEDYASLGDEAQAINDEFNEYVGNPDDFDPDNWDLEDPNPDLDYYRELNASLGRTRDSRGSRRSTRRGRR